MLPALDLTPWAGWTQIGEPDLFVLVTVGILALRAPPRRADLRLEGFPAVVLVLSLISYLLSVALGLALPGPEGGSATSICAPAMRCGSPRASSWRSRYCLFYARECAHAATRWFGTGMAAGLALVAAAILAERGGYIGAHLAVALPFLLVFMLRPHGLSLLAMFGIAISAGHVLIVTFARAAYAAALISTLTAGLCWRGLRAIAIRAPSPVWPTLRCFC